MSIQINYEEVANNLAVKIARLELQNASYEVAIQQLQKQLEEAQGGGQNVE